MGKTSVGLLGAVAGLATMGAAHAATPAAPHPSDALQAASYGELLQPVRNATELMKADDAARVQGSADQRNIRTIDDDYYREGPPRRVTTTIITIIIITTPPMTTTIITITRPGKADLVSAS